MHDLHDTVGAKLLTLSYILPVPKHQQVARDALQNLRQLISLSLQTTPITLSIYLADWRAETGEYLEGLQVNFIWEVDDDLLDRSITPRQVLEINEFIKTSLRDLMSQLPLGLKFRFSALNHKQLAIQIETEPNHVSAFYSS